MRIAFFLSITLVSNAIDAVSQISITATGGIMSSTDTDGKYEMDVKWPAPGSYGSKGCNFLQDGTGADFQLNVLWEASKVFSTGLIYQSQSISTPVSKRHASTANLGVLFKLNFVKNNHTVVPFVQFAYTFINQSTVSQEAVTSTVYANQKQPTLSDQSASSAEGLFVDLGTEVKLSPSTSIIFTGGVHGYHLALDNSSAALAMSSLNYGTNVQSPSTIDGTVFRQFNAGLKYYFGKRKMKRDF
jgi:hypothetical protein